MGPASLPPTSILSPVEFDSANTFMEKLFDNHLIITRYIPGDKPEDRVVEEYAVDTDTGLISSRTLQYHNEGRLDSVNIVCENDIEFLVVNGTDSSTPMHTFQKAFIAKEDYWNGIPNYTPITHSLTKHTLIFKYVVSCTRYHTYKKMHFMT